MEGIVVKQEVMDDSEGAFMEYVRAMRSIYKSEMGIPRTVYNERMDRLLWRSSLRMSKTRTAILIDMLPMDPKTGARSSPPAVKESSGTPAPGPIKKSFSADGKAQTISTPCCRSMVKKPRAKKPSEMMAKCMKYARHSTSEYEKLTKEVQEDLKDSQTDN